jgi:hypothetical protein
VAGNEGDKMELKVSHEEGYVLAATVGTVDDAARELFRESLHPLVGQSGTNLVLDLSQSKTRTALDSWYRSSPTPIPAAAES